MDQNVHRDLGRHEADINTLKEDIQEIKNNQKIILDFINEQKTGRKYAWLLFGALATFIGVAINIVNGILNFLKFKGISG